MTNHLQRYARQVVLPEIGATGQETLLDSRVLIVGAGGLGSAAALYLAGAGVGKLILADRDSVDLSNLHRQILHGQADIGRPKSESGKDRIQALNPEIAVEAFTGEVGPDSLTELVGKADLVLDGSDNFPTRFAVNAACVAARKPLVSGAAIRLQGQVTRFVLNRPDSACYRCLYPEDGPAQEACEDAGILAPLVGVVGSLQAVEGLKILLGLGETDARLWRYDAYASSWREVKIGKDPNCPTCSKEPNT